jgi:hypothetical protein
VKSQTLNQSIYSSLGYVNNEAVWCGIVIYCIRQTHARVYDDVVDKVLVAVKNHVTVAMEYSIYNRVDEIHLSYI